MQRACRRAPASVAVAGSGRVVGGAESGARVRSGTGVEHRLGRTPCGDVDELFTNVSASATLRHAASLLQKPDDI